MSPPDRQLQSASTLDQEPQGNTDVALRPFQVGEVLPRRMSVADMCRAFGIGRSHFHSLQRAGKFDRFELQPRIGARAWSGTLVARYLDCEAGASRFVTVGTRGDRKAG